MTGRRDKRMIVSPQPPGGSLEGPVVDRLKALKVPAAADAPVSSKSPMIYDCLLD